MVKKYVAYGPGFSGSYDTIEEAYDVLENNGGNGAIYIRIDLRVPRQPIKVPIPQGRILR